MSFTAKDNNIKITNSSGTTVFDTSTPMPHITNTISTNITHTFPSSATYLNKYKNWCWYFGGEPEYIKGSSFLGYYGVLAKEHESIYNLATVDSNINPDFLLVQASAYRSTAGSVYKFGTFTTTIPQNTIISANGTTILEAGSRYPGVTWLIRIMSVYLEGNIIKCSFKHSNSTFGIAEYKSDCGEYYNNVEVDTFPWPDFSSPYTSSTWAISFTIYVGKFTL